MKKKIPSKRFYCDEKVNYRGLFFLNHTENFAKAFKRVADEIRLDQQSILYLLFGAGPFLSFFFFKNPQ